MGDAIISPAVGVAGHGGIPGMPALPPAPPATANKHQVGFDQNLCRHDSALGTHKQRPNA